MCYIDRLLQQRDNCAICFFDVNLICLTYVDDTPNIMTFWAIFLEHRTHLNTIVVALNECLLPFQQTKCFYIVKTKKAFLYHV